MNHVFSLGGLLCVTAGDVCVSNNLHPPSPTNMQLVLKSQHCNLEECAIGRAVILRVVVMRETCTCPSLSLVDVLS